MKFNIISSNLVLGIYFFFLGLCVLDVHAEVSVQSYPPRIRQISSLTTRAEHVDSDLSPINSVKPAASLKLFRRARPWTEEEEQRLLELREQQISWDEIQKSFPDRSWDALTLKYSVLRRDPSKPAKNPKSWTDQERNLLLKLVERNSSWEEIAENFPERTMSSIKGQYNYLLREKTIPKGTKRRYTAKEDELLLKLGEAGIPWKERVTYFDDRDEKGLMYRYAKLISPKSKVTSSEPKKKQLGKFSSEEDNLLIEAFESGKTVEEISRSLERSAASIRRRRRKLEQSNQLDRALSADRRYTVAELELISELAEKGMYWKDIVTEYFPRRNATSMRRAYERYQAQKQTGEEEKD